MTLDRYAKRVLDMVAAGRRGGATASADLTPEGMRQSMNQLAAAVDVRNVPLALVENHTIDAGDRIIPIRIYAPAMTTDVAAPGIVYFHGGTGVFCSIETHDGLCRLLAASSECRVVSVDYRLAPEHPFPAAIDDSVFATRWIADHASELGIDPARLIVAGDSAGGTLAAVVCQVAARDGGPAIALQVLICPVTDLSRQSPSREELAEGYFIERATLDWAKAIYCPGEDFSDPRISPLRARSFAGLQPAHIHTAEFDPMRDEGKAYADALVDAGVDCEYTMHSGLIHHFYCMAGAIPRAREVLTSIGSAIRDAVAAPA